MSLRDKIELKEKDLKEVLRRVSDRTKTDFENLRDWDFHHYDFGTFTDPHNSVNATERKMQCEGHNTVDDAVMLYVLKAFNAISSPSKFKEYAGKAKALLDAVAESY